MPGTKRHALSIATVVALLTGCSAPDRSAVRWSDLDVSADRRTLTVTTWYGGFCHKLADGIDVDVRTDEVVISVWLRDARPDGDGTCNMECGQVTQTVTLDVPLPDDRPFRPPHDHVLGCGDVSG